MDSFVTTYGYLALALGVFLEGEAALITASFAANKGYLIISLVVLIAFCVTLTLDWGYFFLGRYQGRAFLLKRPRLLDKTKRIHYWIERYPTGIMLGFRFIYGFRMLIPLIIGTTGVKVRQFMLFSAISAFVWAVLFGIAGYLLGPALQDILTQAKSQIEGPLLVLAAGVVTWLVIRYIRKKNRTVLQQTNAQITVEDNASHKAA